MRLNLLFTLGCRVFGLGFLFDWYPGEFMVELQLGPVNVFGGDGWGWALTVFGRTVWLRH